MGSFPETYNDPKTFIVTARGEGEKGGTPYTGRLHPRGVPYSGLRYMKG